MRPGGTRALFVLALVLLGAACSDGVDGLPRPSTTTTVDQIGPTITTQAPAVGQSLVVEEQGLSSFQDPYDKRATLGSYAVVIRNPDPVLLAAGIRVRTRFLDAAGNELLVDTAFLNGVMPGARMAVGRTLIEPIGAPSSLAVTIEVTEWFTPAFSQLLTAEAVSTDVDLYGGAATRFAVQSTLPVAEQGVDVTAVYRNAEGRAIGAESSTLRDVTPGAPVLGQIPLLAPIPGTASTEVLIGRGFGAQTTG